MSSSKISMAEEAHSHNLIIDTREIFLHGSYAPDEGDPGVDWRMANTLVKNLKILEKVSANPIYIHQMSIGGDEEAGYMMYDAIKHSKCHITIYAHGVAASMGSIVPQAADHRITMPNCCWLIHRGTTGISPHLTRKQARSWACWEDFCDKRMIDIYVAQCKKAPYHKGKKESQVRSEIKRKLDAKGDWFLTAEEAVEFGFANAVEKI
jgi:ATP-dependent protease ClpP protease subunit